MAKKKQKSKIKNWLYIELITLFLLLSYLIWFGIPENVFGKKSEVRDEVEGNPGSHLGGVQTSGKPIQQVQDKQLRVPILMYHYIGGNPDPSDVARDNLSVTPEKFDEQMGYLASLGYTPITLDTMVSSLYGQAELPEKPLVLTFDDGYADFYFNAFPILSKYSFKSVLFVPTGLIERESYLSWEQLEKLNSSGLVSIQAHSVNHAHLSSLNETEILYELSESKRTLEEKYGTPVNFVAYPFGASNETVLNVAKRAGYIGALGTWSSKIQSEGTLFNMPRIKISGQFDLTTFASKI